MSKGSKPAGNITTSTTSATQQAQSPYLNDMWAQAQSLYQNNPMQYYPGQTLAATGQPERVSGYQNYYNTANNLSAGLGTANTAFNTALTGGYGGADNPANPYYQSNAAGTSIPEQYFNQLQGAAQNAGNLYSNAVRQYAPQMQQAGANAANAAENYAQNIGQYAAPIAGMANAAGANNNLGLSQLGNTASGSYLNSNPYINAAIQAAQDPVTRNYQTAIAPQTDAMFSGGGRYGSGAMANAVSTGQQNLARGLGDISTNMMNANYARERTAQDTAAQNYGQLYNSGLGLGMTGLQNAAGIQNQAGSMYLAGADRAQTGLQNAAATQAAAGSQYWQGQTAAQQAANQYAQASQYGIAGLNNAFNTGNQAAMDALRQYPQFAQSQFIGPQGQVTAGTGLAGVDQAMIDDSMKRYYGMQNAPYDTLSKYQGYIGTPVGGTGSETKPYFQNQGAEVLSGISGIAGLGRSLFGKI
jgi:hypothetical protein